MKSITKLSLVLLTAMALGALPATAEDTTATNAPPPAPVRRAPGLRGTITAVDATAMTITVKTARDGDVTVKVTSDTKITKDRQPAVFAEAKEGLSVSVTGKKNDDGTWNAAAVRVSTRAPRRPPAQAAPPAPSSDQK